MAGNPAEMPAGQEFRAGAPVHQFSRAPACSVPPCSHRAATGRPRLSLRHVRLPTVGVRIATPAGDPADRSNYSDRARNCPNRCRPARCRRRARAPAAAGRGRAPTGPIAVGSVLFVIGLLAVGVIMVLFATGVARPAAVAEPGRDARAGRFRDRVDRHLRARLARRGRARAVPRAPAAAASAAERPTGGQSHEHPRQANGRPGVVQVAQHVDDLDRATAFYTETLGLPLIARFGPLVFVDLGGTRLLLEEAAPPAMIYLQVADLRGTAWTACGRPGSRWSPNRTTSSPTPTACSAATGEIETQAFIRDSEGNLVGLVTHAERHRRQLSSVGQPSSVEVASVEVTSMNGGVSGTWRQWTVATR